MCLNLVLAISGKNLTRIAAKSEKFSMDLSLVICRYYHVFKYQLDFTVHSRCLDNFPKQQSSTKWVWTVN